MLAMPSAAITTKYSSITGPKNSPILAVPLDWMTNSAMMMSPDSGSTRCDRLGCATASPSTAPSTVTAGVIMLSP